MSGGGQRRGERSRGKKGRGERGGGRKGEQGEKRKGGRRVGLTRKRLVDPPDPLVLLDDLEDLELLLLPEFRVVPFLRGERAGSARGERRVSLVSRTR